MAPRDLSSFESNSRDAQAQPPEYARPMIRSVMNRSDWGVLIALALIWGSAFFFIRLAVHEVPTLTYVWLRLALAAAVLWLFVWWSKERLALPRRVWGAILLLTLLNNVVPFILFGWGQLHIASGLASILNATTPLWGVVVAHLFTRDEKLSGAKLAGALIGFGGVAVMVGPALLGSIGTNVAAQLACVGGSLCYALAGVWARRFKAMDMPPMTVATGQLTAGALVMLPIALLIEQPWLEPMPSAGAWGAILVLAVVCSSFAYVLYFRLIASAGATNALLVTLLVPPIAIAIGALFLGEVIAPREFAGMALIALGLATIDGRLFSALRPAALQRAA